MNAAAKIAKNELRSLFFSPIAWTMLIVFVTQTSFVYLSQIANVIRWEFAGYEPPMTFSIFAGFRALFDQLYANLVFYMPLLTMGLISREKQNGSIRLLMSSPVTVSQILIGKYVALLTYLSLFVGFVLCLILLTGTLIPGFDYTFAFSGLLGFSLLVSTYAAVGLFMSSLTNHQIVAAISTIALLAALGFVGTLGQRIPVIDDIAYWLSIAGRADIMRGGLIASKDVFYFVSIIALFLAFTFLKLSAGRRAEPTWVRGGKYAGVSMAIVAFGAVTSTPHLTVYADMTRFNSQSLSKGSQEAIADLEGELNVMVLVNALDTEASSFLPVQRNNLYRRLFEKHERKIGSINVAYQFYYADSENAGLYESNPGKSNKELAREFALQNRLNFEEFLSQKEVDALFGFAAEKYRNVYLLEWNGRRSVVRNFDDPRYFPDESQITAGIRRLIAEPQFVAYATGNGERRILRGGGGDHRRHISDVRDRFALLNHGFDVEEVTLDDAIPDHIDILVIAAPTIPFAPSALGNLRAYLDAGGNALLLGEQDSIGILNPLIGEFGVSLLPGQVRQTKEEFPEDLILAPKAAEAEGFAVVGRRADWPIVLPGASALTIIPTSEFDARPLLLFTDDMTLEDDTRADALAVTVEKLEDGSTQRIVVIGDADFMSTATRSIRDPQRRTNPEFINSVFGYLANGEYPIDTSRPLPLDISISIDLRDIELFRIVFFGLLPVLLLVSGSWIILQRRRH